jgi:hypothetical protein
MATGPGAQDEVGPRGMRDRRPCFVAVVASLLMAGCTYPAKVPPSPAYDVTTSYEAPLVGHYLLLVDPSPLDGSYRVDGITCGMHRYPVDLREAFAESVARTLQPLLGQIERVDVPFTPEQIRLTGSSGLVRVRADDMAVHLDLAPGLLTSRMAAEVAMAADVTVDGPQGRLLGVTVATSDTAERPLGWTCGGGTAAIDAAAEAAVHDLSRRIGEQISNAPRLRETATPAAAG